MTSVDFLNKYDSIQEALRLPFSADDAFHPVNQPAPFISFYYKRS